MSTDEYTVYVKTSRKVNAPVVAAGVSWTRAWELRDADPSNLGVRRSTSEDVAQLEDYRAALEECKRLTRERASRIKHTWSDARIDSLIEVVGLPDHVDGRMSRYAQHDELWGHKGRDSAARYMYERLHPEHFSNSRDVAA